MNAHLINNINDVILYIIKWNSWKILEEMEKWIYLQIKVNKKVFFMIRITKESEKNSRKRYIRRNNHTSINLECFCHLILQFFFYGFLCDGNIFYLQIFIWIILSFSLYLKQVSKSDHYNLKWSEDTKQHGK